MDWNDRDDSRFAFWNLRSARDRLAGLRNRRATSHGRAAEIDDARRILGRRWNGAFNQLVFEIVFRPVARSTGPILGTIIAFLASGLIHELVISLPARADYGLPTAYFLLQGCGVLVQHRDECPPRSSRPIPHHPHCGRFRVLAFSSSVRNVILPFMKAIGAL